MWPDRHLTPALVDELRQRLERYRIEATTLFGAAEVSDAFKAARAAFQKQVLGDMLRERLECLRLALGTAQDFALEAGPLQVTPLVVSLLTLPAEVQLLRDALAHP